MLKKYGILGSGTAADNVIEDGLVEIGEDNEFVVGCPSKPSESMARAIDWLIDREIRYTIVCTEKAPSRFIDNASHCEYRTTDEEIEKKVLSILQKANGSLLLLWDREKNEAMEGICFAADDFGIDVRDLSNGLVPLFVATEPIPVSKEKHIPTAEIEVEPLSEKELRSMPIAMLHKIAKSKGLNPDLNYETTDALIQRLLYADSINEGEQEEEYLPPIDLGTFKIVKADSVVATNGEATCMLTATFPNGSIMSRPATPYEVQQLFGFKPSTS